MSTVLHQTSMHACETKSDSDESPSYVELVTNWSYAVDLLRLNQQNTFEYYKYDSIVCSLGSICCDGARQVPVHRGQLPAFRPLSACWSTPVRVNVNVPRLDENARNGAARSLESLLREKWKHSMETEHGVSFLFIYFYWTAFSTIKCPRVIMRWERELRWQPRQKCVVKEIVCFHLLRARVTVLITVRILDASIAPRLCIETWSLVIHTGLVWLYDILIAQCWSRAAAE